MLYRLSHQGIWAPTFVLNFRTDFRGQSVALPSTGSFRYKTVISCVEKSINCKGRSVLNQKNFWVAKSFQQTYSCLQERMPLLLLLLSHFSHVRLCVTPETAAHEAPPSLGFSRQEHWSGLPFPSPMHESEKGKWSRSVVSDSSRPHGLQPTRLLHPWDSPGKSTGVGCHCF